MTQKFQNPWDATFAITGSVYSATPTYAAGAEVGLAVYTAPASKIFSPEIGAPARNMNWVLKALGDLALYGLQTQAMTFHEAKDWFGNTLDCAAWSPSNGQFVIGSHSSATASVVSASRDGRASGSLVLDNTMGAFPATALLDSGSGIWEFTAQGSSTTSGLATSSTVTYYGTAHGNFRKGAQVSATTSVAIASSGTATTFYGISGTAFTSLSSATTGFDLSTTATWFSAQATPGQGPAIFATRGTVGTLLWRTVDGTSVTTVTRPDSTHYLGGLAWDDAQSLFISCTDNSGTLSFYSSADGITWAAMTGPVSPSGFTITGNIQFDICCGVWLIAGNQITPSTFVRGFGASLRTAALYSTDFGVSWRLADLEMLTPANDSAHVVHSDDRFLIWTDADACCSGRLGS